MKNQNVHAAVGGLIALLLSLGLFGYLAYSQTGTVKETVEVGSQGIKKAQEIKLELESQTAPD